MRSFGRRRRSIINKCSRAVKFQHIVPVAKRAQRALTAVILAFFDGNCAKECFPHAFIFRTPPAIPDSIHCLFTQWGEKPLFPALMKSAHPVHFIKNDEMFFGKAVCKMRCDEREGLAFWADFCDQNALFGIMEPDKFTE